MLAETVPFQTVDSAATDRVVRDLTSFVEFRQISKGSRCIYMKNNASAAALRMSTYKLELRGGHTLYFYDVLYALEVR